MRALKLILGLCLITAIFSCQQEESLVQPEAEIKSLTFKHGDKSYAIDFQLQDGELTQLTDFPAELRALQKNNDITLRLGEDNEILLVNESEINTREEQNSDLALSTGDDPFTVDPNFVSTFGLGEVNHYAYVVADQNEAIETYTEQFDAKHWWYKPRLTQKKYFIDGQEVEYTVDLVFGFANGNQIEVFEADASEDNIFGNYLAQQEGYQHIGFGVKNLSAATTVFNDNGYDVILSGEFKTKLGLVSKLVFFDTRDLIGVYTELVEARLFGFNVDQNEALLIFGVLLGDVELIHVD